MVNEAHSSQAVFVALCFTEGYYKVTLHNHDTFVHHVYYGMLAFKAFTCHRVDLELQMLAALVMLLLL